MLKDERHQKILQIVNEQKFVKNNELAQLTNSTIRTIISDVTVLDHQKRLIKVYGGAKSLDISLHLEKYEEEKENLSSKAKEEIAKKAAQLINDGDCIFMDTGTTTRKMVKYIEAKNLTIVTNGYEIAKELSEYGFEAILAGGIFLPKTRALVGGLTIKMLAQFAFDNSFLGMNAINSHGIFTTNTFESSVKEFIIKNSQKTYVLIDSSKANTSAPIKVEYEPEQIEIISDKDLNFK